MHGKQPLAQPANVVFLYDGSFEGFLCCVYHTVYSRQIPLAIYTPENTQPTLFEERSITTDSAQAQKVRASIPAKISPAALEMVETVFLSCLAEKELALLKFLLLGYQQGSKILHMLGHPDVAPVLKAEQHLQGERHLLLGFVRFSDYGGVLAATITPKNFILPFLASHFTARFSQEDFLIYDKTHKAALIYQNGQTRLAPLEEIEFPDVSETETEYRKLWKQFYHTIAIEARYNPKCRITHIPKRYWQNMTELAELL
ncbi:TIGR03915 family putative DNA repair protein [Ruminococcaceae bacterium OttesenSCG-928-A16]|nr:TIGR03915 family putative DNA repair protein [Ruminococcaceae bacterium OttesenSCG-928-A16]